MRDTWTERDLPVLNAIVETFEDSGPGVSPEQIEERTGLDTKTVQRALTALESEEPPFLSQLERVLSGQVVFIGAPTGHARRAVGAWPTAEVIAERLVEALAEAADREPDEERKSFLRKTATYLANAGRDLAVDIGAAAINRQMGM